MDDLTQGSRELRLAEQLLARVDEANRLRDELKNLKVDGLKTLWEEQRQLQIDMGLDPETFSDVDRARIFTDYLAHLHEEAGDIGRARPTYKRHILRTGASRSGVLDGCVDVIKMTMAIAQLEGVTWPEFEAAFKLKTQVVLDKHREERLKMEKDTLVFCFDIDDVIADLEPFRQELSTDAATGGAAAVVVATASERMKHHFYEGGGFRELEPLPGAVLGMQRIKREYGAIHVLITARPQWRYKRLQADTVWWLKKLGIPYDMLIFARNKVEALTEHVAPAWPSVFVEDHLRNARDLSEAGVNVLLFDRPHNRSVEVGQRVQGWAGIEKALRALYSKRILESIAK